MNDNLPVRWIDPHRCGWIGMDFLETLRDVTSAGDLNRQSCAVFNREKVRKTKEVLSYFCEGIPSLDDGDEPSFGAEFCQTALNRGHFERQDGSGAAVALKSPLPQVFREQRPKPPAERALSRQDE